MKPFGFREYRCGYTRADLAVVVVVATLAMGMLMVVATQQRESSRRLQCERNFTQTSESIIRYDEFRGQLPGWRMESGGQPRSWVVAVLPYLDIRLSDEERASGRRADHPGPWKKLADQMAKPTDASGKSIPSIGSLICPTVPPRKRSVAPLSMGVNGGMPDVTPAKNFPPDWPANGVFQDGTYSAQRWKISDIAGLDGVESTVLLAENIDAGPWTSVEESQLAVLWFPEGLQETPSPLLSPNEMPGAGDGSLRFARPAGLHKGGWITAYCDGSVKWTHGQIVPALWSQLMSVDGTQTRLPGQEGYLPAPYRREPVTPLSSETATEDSDEPNPVVPP